MAGRREATPPPDVPEGHELLEKLLTVPGNTFGVYNRFRSPPYSVRNLGWLMMQGAAIEPHGPYKFWPTVNRNVMRGASAYWILRPITVTDREQLDDNGNPKKYTRFKPVKGAFGLSQTEGEELPPLETPDWQLTRALGSLSMNEIPFESFEGNMAGYSFGRNVAISPVAPNRLKTAVHEIAHVLHGHTVESSHEEYMKHRGLYEWEAEATAYMVLNELGAMDERTDSISRSYVQNWLRGEKPGKDSIKKVLSGTDAILRAGYLAVSEELAEPA